ncbi:hypothetical protein [Jhaorihella thermophila]|uniref:hypothetical protein n=1 Tax=Jhaorihella thermophila TaxID=488547 RepID=UPI00135B277B|nr:hypothetical protein [Jhaorihella thermophila]
MNSDPPSIWMTFTGKDISDTSLSRKRAAALAVRRWTAMATLQREAQSMAVNWRACRPAPRLTLKLSICTTSPGARARSALRSLRAWGRRGRGAARRGEGLGHQPRQDAPCRAVGNGKTPRPQHRAELALAP